jgi:hypothetical protein
MITEESTSQKIITESGTRGRGGYHDEEDYSESRKRSQRVRGEFLTPTYKAKATFAYESVTFNMSCVQLFPDNQYVALDVDVPNLRVIVSVCEGGDTFSLKFANRKNGKKSPVA